MTFIKRVLSALYYGMCESRRAQAKRELERWGVPYENAD